MLQNSSKCIFLSWSRVLREPSQNALFVRGTDTESHWKMSKNFDRTVQFETWEELVWPTGTDPCWIALCHPLLHQRESCRCGVLGGLIFLDGNFCFQPLQRTEIQNLKNPQKNWGQNTKRRPFFKTKVAQHCTSCPKIINAMSHKWLPAVGKAWLKGDRKTAPDLFSINTGFSFSQPFLFKNRF